MLQSRSLLIVIQALAYIFLLFDCLKAISRPQLKGQPDFAEINRCIFNLDMTQISPVVHDMGDRALSPQTKVTSKSEPFKNYEQCFLFHLKFFINFFSSFLHFPDSKGQVIAE